MDKFELFPNKNRLLLGAAYGVGALWLARIAWRNAADLANTDATGPTVFAIFAAVVGALFLISSARAWLSNRPAFAADDEGFSVMGKRKQPWQAFHGVKIHRVWIGPLPGPAWVSVRLGTGMFAKKQQISWTHLPGPAKDTAGAILQLAEMAGAAPARST